MPRKWNGESDMELAESRGEYDRWLSHEQAVCWPDEDEAYDRQRQEEIDNEK